MSALPTPILPAPAKPDLPAGLAWIDLDEAARRLSRNVGHTARRCRDEWAAAGLAQIRTPESGGKARWYVHESADPLLSRCAGPEALSKTLDRTQLTDAQRRQLDARIQIVRDWESALASGQTLGFSRDQSTAQYLQLLDLRGTKLSRATLHNWRTAWRRDGYAGLLDARSIRDPQSAIPNDQDPFFAAVKRLFLDPRRRSLVLCHELATQLAIEDKSGGWPMHTYKACQRMVAKLPAQLIALRRGGKKEFEDNCEPSIRRDYAALASNERWNADHHEFDVMVIDPACNIAAGEAPRFVRPFITAFQDMRSRKIVGHRIVAVAPNADDILAAFETAAREHGLPGLAYFDNGKDFDSRKLQGETKKQRRRRSGSAGVPAHSLLSPDEVQRIDGAFNILGIKVQHTWIYHGQSKPIERNFGTLCSRFSKLWKTYCGKDTAEKPEDLKAALASGQAPTLAEFAAAFDAWLTSDYHLRPHTGDGMNGQCPAAVWEECLDAKRTVAPEILSFACMPRYGPYRFNKEGITHKGVSYGGFDQQLQKLFGQQVLLAEISGDANRVMILEISGRRIGEAKANRKLPHGANKEDLAAAIKEKRQLRKTMKAYIEKRPRMSEDIPALAERAALERARKARGTGAPPVTDPAPVRMHRTAFDDQLPDLKQVFNQERPERIAVGAESLSFSALNTGGDDDAGEPRMDPLSALRYLRTGEE